MDIKIMQGCINHLDDCEEALVNSELGKRYFSEIGSARKSLEEGFHKNEIYVAVENSNCKGFIWVIKNGIFHSFPYIHIVAVKSENRGQGIGELLLRFVENEYFANYSRLFLVVADFNPKAKKFYERLGYSEICEIPDLYRKGISECLMMKLRS